MPIPRWPVALVALTLLLGGCQPAASSPVSARNSPSATPRPTPSPLAPCPAGPAAGGPEILKAGLPAPDDLAFLPDGRLLFSDIKTGSVSALSPDGAVVVIAAGLSAPEGLVVAADGRLLVGEQGKNRVVAIDLASQTRSVWHSFLNRTGRDGLDGIGPLLPNGDVIVPDSPNGVVWRVSADGKTATRIASGMSRPVGAAVDAQGRIFVADEGGPLWILEPAQRRLASLQTPDDVLVAKDGHLFVNTIGDSAIHELDPSGRAVNVMRAIRGPQGIALDGADNLYYTEFDAGRIARIVRTFSLDRSSVSRTNRGTDVVCLGLRRAAGFTSALTLVAAPKASTTVLALRQPTADSSGELEVSSGETSLTFSLGNGTLALSQTVALP